MYLDEKEVAPDLPQNVDNHHALAPAAAPLRLTLSVGGMTCASCSGAITSAVGELPGVSDVVVQVIVRVFAPPPLSRVSPACLDRR